MCSIGLPTSGCRRRRYDLPPTRQNPHGPDDGRVDHVDDEGGEGDLASGHTAHAHPLHQRPAGWGGQWVPYSTYSTSVHVLM